MTASRMSHMSCIAFPKPEGEASNLDGEVTVRLFCMHGCIDMYIYICISIVFRQYLSL